MTTRDILNNLIIDVEKIKSKFFGNSSNVMNLERSIWFCPEASNHNPLINIRLFKDQSWSPDSSSSCKNTGPILSRENLLASTDWQHILQTFRSASIYHAIVSIYLTRGEEVPAINLFTMYEPLIGICTWSTNYLFAPLSRLLIGDS